MLSNHCEFECLRAGCKCKRCNQNPLGRDYEKPPKRICVQVAVCPHLGARVDMALIRCQSCRGNVRIKYPLHLCALYGECLPTHRGEYQIRCCPSCPDNPVNQR